MLIHIKSVKNHSNWWHYYQNNSLGYQIIKQTHTQSGILSCSALAQAHKLLAGVIHTKKYLQLSTNCMSDYRNWIECKPQKKDLAYSKDVGIRANSPNGHQWTLYGCKSHSKNTIKIINAVDNINDLNQEILLINFNKKKKKKT